MHILDHTACIVKTLRKECRAIKDQSRYRIQFFNCWNQKNEDMYWRQFIENRHLMDGFNGNVAIFSVFGRRNMVDKVRADVKIFYSAENLMAGKYDDFVNYCLDNPDVGLAMGFDFLDDERYLRFPLWMDYMFDPWFSEEDIREKCRKLRYPCSSGKSGFCCMVASNPGDGLRKEMYDAISAVGPVSSAGRFLHNDDSLRLEFNDVKTDYLSKFAFNICPENTDADGYVTEKLFESIDCGCIPVYWGSCLNPEPSVLNKDAIILWDRKDGGASAIRQIWDLYNSPSAMREFISQPRLLNTAEEYILDTFRLAETKIKKAICK